MQNPDDAATSTTASREALAKGDTATATDAEVHALGMERFRLASQAYDKQAERELKALKFAMREHWTPEEKEARKGFTAGTLTIGARPTLSIDTLRQPIQQLENQQRQANLAVDIHPKPGGDKATAEVIQGLYRDIQVTSRADQIARFWAYSRAMKAGRGVYRIERVYEHEAPEADDPARFDQVLRISRILNQAAVLLDPFAQEPDWSDGTWAFIKGWRSKHDYCREHPKSVFADLDDDTFSLIGANAPGWLKRDGETWSILEVEYLYVSYGAAQTLTARGGQRRVIQRRTVYSCKMNAKEVYDSQDLQVEFIPIVPVIANEENIDGERVWEGIVGPAMDSCRTEDFMTSGFVETVALAPRSPWVATIEQIGPYKDWWSQSNSRAFPFLPYVARQEAGTLLPPPQRQFAEPPVQALAQGMQMFRGITNAITGFNDPARGAISGSERSGVALKALQKQTETGNSGYLDNLAQISMTYEARVVLSWIPTTYDRPGRLARVLGIDNQASTVMLNAPFVQGPSGPVPPPPGTQTADVVEHTLKAGAFGATVKIGKSHTDARDEAAETLGGIIQAEPQLLMLIGDLYFDNLDGPGMPEIAKRLKKLLPPQLQDEQAGGQPNVQQLQQQNAQMQAALQQLQPLADQNQAKLQQAQLEAQSKQAITQAQIESQQQIESMRLETQRQIEQIKAEMTVQVEQHRAFAQTQTAAGKAQADYARAAMQESAETHRLHVAHAHEAAVGAAEAGVSAGQQASEHAHARRLQAEQPKPNGSGQ